MEEIVLRQWIKRDLEPFAQMNADVEVMRHFPSVLSRDESEAMFKRLFDGIEEHGWGLWAVEVDGKFAGFTGLSVPRFDAAFTPCVELGWRFCKHFWGRGIAYRASLQALAFGFNTLALKEIVSFTAVSNQRSWRLMERLEFTHDPKDDFDHPRLPDGHPLKRHVLYRKCANRSLQTI